MRKSFAPALLLAASTAAFAENPPDTDALEARIAALEAQAQAMREQTAQVLAALDAARAEIAQLKSAPVASAPPAAPPPSATSSADSSGNAFNPAISVILDGQYAHHSLDGDAYARSGFPLVGEGEPSPDGLSLGESELSLAANVDDKFYGQLTLAAETEDGADSVGIEEAFIDTTALPAGWSLRAGRFFSNIGYLNSHHTHTDKFPDRPLAYQAFLGNQYGDDGVQVRWVAPTDTYLEFSGEALRGNAVPAEGASHDGVGAYTLAVHAGGDVGDENSWLAGVSYLDADARDGSDGFSGDEQLWLADFTWKWAPDGNTKDGGIQLRSEYFHESRDGDFVDPDGVLAPAAWNGNRSGAYVEGVYRINRQWETGYRYDKLWAGDDTPYANGFDPYRHGVVLTWLNSEFSLLRLLLSYDRPNEDDSDRVLTLQYQVSFGAHGAHKF